MLNIQVPNLSTRNALDWCYELSTTENTSKLLLDVTNVTGYQPMAMVMATSALRQYMVANSLTGADVTLLYDENNTRNLSYGEHMGFYNAIGVELAQRSPAASTSTCIPLQKISLPALRAKYIAQGKFLYDGDIIELEAAKLADVLAQGQSELKKVLTYLLRETIRNIPEHSGTEDVWICGQYWRSRDEAEVAILDEGIGIFRSLSKNVSHRKYVLDEREALHWAIRPGVSEAFAPARGQRDMDVWANSGYGLYMIKNICCKLGGRFDIASKGAFLRCYANGRTKAGFTCLPGTAVGIRLQPSKLCSVNELLDEIRAAGISEAQTIQNAFKEASIPSKGLMYNL